MDLIKIIDKAKIKLGDGKKLKNGYGIIENKITPNLQLLFIVAVCLICICATHNVIISPDKIDVQRMQY